MDRRLLVLSALVALLVGGCSRDKSPPPTAAAAPVKAEMRVPEVPGLDANQVAAAGPALPGASDNEATDAQQQQALAARARAAEIRRKALEELQGATVLGAFGSPGTQNGGENLFGTAEAQDQNPLRTDAPRLAPQGTAPPSTAVLGGGSPIKPSEAKAGAVERVILGGGAAPPSPPVAFQPEPPPATVEDESAYDVVEVLYGTDRLAGAQKASDAGHLLLQFLPTLLVAGLAVGLVIIGIQHRNWLLGSVAVTGLAACLLLGYDAVDEVLSRIRGATHQGPRYTTDRSADGRIDVGRCEVTIPHTHVRGEVETPSVLRFEINEDVRRHLVLQKTERLANPKFCDLLRHRVGQSARRELFVFVHGFNVSFEEAALRTAQIHHDLKFEGAPIFFSWPANDKFIFTYPADETNVAWSVPHLKQFLLEIVKESKAQSVNLIAHSMGNRALAAALREIELEMHDQARLFNQVILAAPDIDADDFRNNIAPAMQKTARGLTLYASSHDEALLASQFIHRQPRAGDAGDGLTVLAGIDTIDVTAIDQSFFGHSYYGSSHPVLNDLKALLTGTVPPRDRVWLSPAERDGLTYWIFQPERTAAAESGLNR
jgi:esterase/lipase superfamily enzyme